MKYEILAWDSDFFGFAVARIKEPCLSYESFKAIYQELKKTRVKLVYWSSDLNCMAQNEISVAFKGQLLDIKTRFMKDLRRASREETKGPISYEYCLDKEPGNRLLEIALQCGEYSRFKIDSNIPLKKFEELYQTWLIKSLNRELADEVIITKKNDLITGLITVDCRDHKGTIGLVGVHHDSRGSGQGSVLLQAALNYFIENQCPVAYVVTQGSNMAACRFYEKFGFVVIQKSNFYHFWIN